MNFIKLIKENDHHLTTSEHKIANYIASHYEKVIYFTLKDLGKATNSGDGTIIRLCKKLGFTGFSDLKIALAQESMLTKPSNSNSSYIESSTNQLINSIEKTHTLIDPTTVEKAIDMISNASSVHLFGVGHSGQSALDYEKTWLRIGLIAHASIDPHIQVQVASLLNKDDVAIGLSLSGHTKDTYDSLLIAKNNGAKIIAVTNNLVSPIANLADIVIQTAVGEFLNIGSVAGQVSQLFICDVIARGFEQRNKIDTDIVKERALKAVMAKSI